MNIPYGFLDGEPPRGNNNVYRVGYALVWPRSNPGKDRPWCDGKSAQEVFFTDDFGVMTTDGWIGWNYTPLIYHPKPIPCPKRPIDRESWFKGLAFVLNQ